MEIDLNVNFVLDGQLKAVLAKHRYLNYYRLIDSSVVLEGKLAFELEYEGLRWRDVFDVKIKIPESFPRKMPKVWEIGGRVPPDFHKNPDETLCLETSTGIEIALSDNCSLLEYMDQVLVRYLFGYSFWEKIKRMPFGERSHGAIGVLEFYMEFFGECDLEGAKRLLSYLAKGKRISRNKMCPCQSGKRIRKCHRNHLWRLLDIRIPEQISSDFRLVHCI